jgi:hypothetical protein
MPDDRERFGSGVVCSILDLGDGKVRLILDDVANSTGSVTGVWKHRSLYTCKDFLRADIDDLKISDQELAELGFSLLARLVALRKHSFEAP